MTRTTDSAGVTQALAIDGHAGANGYSAPGSDTYRAIGAPNAVENDPEACPIR